MVERGEIQDGVAASVHITMSFCREKANVYIVSEKQNKDIIEKLGFNFSNDLNVTLNECMKKQIKSTCRVGIATHGADLAPEYK